MNPFRIKCVIALLLSVFYVTSLASERREIGSTATLRPGEPVPEAPKGMMWRVEGYIENVTVTIPGRPSLPRGPLLQVVMVQMDREQAGDHFKSTAVGGFLPASDSYFQWRLASDEQGKPHLEMYQNFVALLTDKLVVGETTRSVRDSEQLPTLPDGFSWEEQSRVDGVGILIPNLGGDVTSSKDRVTYVLKKDRADLPDQFEQPRVVSGFAKNEIEFAKSLSCGGLLAGKGDGPSLR